MMIYKKGHHYSYHATRVPVWRPALWENLRRLKRVLIVKHENQLLPIFLFLVRAPFCSLQFSNSPLFVFLSRFSTESALNGKIYSNELAMKKLQLELQNLKDGLAPSLSGAKRQDRGSGQQTAPKRPRSIPSLAPSTSASASSSECAKCDKKSFGLMSACRPAEGQCPFRRKVHAKCGGGSAFRCDGCVASEKEKEAEEEEEEQE